MKKVINSVLAISLVGALITLTGCGDTKKSDSDKITLRLWTKLTQDASDKDIEYHDKWFAALEEKFPDVQFEESISPEGSDYRQEYDKALMAGMAPAFTTMFSYTDIPTRMGNGTVAEITEYVEDWDLKKEGKINTVFDDAISSEGKWYALPYKSYVQACLVNKKPLEDAGEDTEKLPETWDEFAAQGERITDFSIPRIGYALVGMDWCAWPYTAWVWSAGGEMVRAADNGKYKIAFNEPEGVDAAMFMNEMIWKYKMTQTDVLMSRSDLAKLIYNNTACYSWNSMSALDDDNLKTYNLKLSDFCSMLMPSKDKSIPRVALAGGEVVTFNPKLSEAELKKAVEVAKYLYFSDEMLELQFEHIKKYGMIDLNVPGRVDLYDKKLDSMPQLTEEIKKNLIELSENSKPEPYCPNWTNIKTELVEPLQTIFLTENITKEEAKRLLDACADKLCNMYPETFIK